MILDFNWQFRPERNFTDLEIRPCVDEGDHIHEPFEGETPHFWSVYVRLEEDENEFAPAYSICDCDTKEQAEEVVEFLTNLILNSKLTNND